MRQFTSGVLVCAAFFFTALARAEFTCAAVRDRVDCSSGVGGSDSGAVKLTQAQCTARGCCFDQSANSSCFYPTEGRAVQWIHMINSNHFDAGYADLTAGVVNEYFDVYFPRAAQVGSDLRGNGSEPLQWMTFSYMISLYFDCPAGYQLHCPSNQSLTQVEEAIRAGDIVWPAYPHNAELATADPSMLKFGVKLSHDLASRFDIDAPTVLSTRDVPGMPRSALSILKEAGVTALSEGMNGRMVAVNVPPAFTWHDPATNTSMLTLWHWHGYGNAYAS